MNILEIIYILEYTCWVLASIAVAYPLIYSLASLGTRKSYYPTAKKQHKFAILFPTYKEDRIIVPVVESFLKQDYPKELFNVIVISDHMQDSTNEYLTQLPITLLKASYENSSKAKALNFAINHFKRDEFDAVVILDADNVVDSNFLSEVNKVIDADVQAIQTHRTAKNRNTEIAVLDGLSEEVNNSIFRRGHVRLGISSALIGSGMVFNYQWFHDNVKYLSTAGEDKELEVLLLKQRIFIEFLDEVYVYDEKTQEEMRLIEIGKNVHTFFERINFIDNKLPYIEDNYYKEKLTKFLNSDFMNKYKEYKKYQEYEFIYQKSNETYHGKIDLLLVGDKEAIIIDYKLKNTKDKAYIEQLNGYKEVITNKLNLPTTCYLYSIIAEKFEKI